jgi:hypothetical protein
MKTQPSTPPAVAARTPDAPVEQRISHRIMLYAAQRAPAIMNQFQVEEIIREETDREWQAKLAERDAEIADALMILYEAFGNVWGPVSTYLSSEKLAAMVRPKIARAIELIENRNALSASLSPRRPISTE